MLASYTPPASARPAEIMVSPWSWQSLGTQLIASPITAGSINWIAANVAVFVPFWLIEATPVTKLWWANGGAVAGNVDVGIFDTSGNVLVSTGSTACSGTNAVQSVDVTDKLLGRGDYYMGMVSDTSGATQKLWAAATAAGVLQSFGLLEQASVTLPFSTGANPATFAKYTRAFLPMFGFQAYRTIGP